MTTQNINKNTSVAPDISSIARDQIDLKKKVNEQENGEINPHTLRDSLEAKRQLISLLEKGGYVKDKDFKALKAEVNQAIADLNAIIKAFAE